MAQSVLHVKRLKLLALCLIWSYVRTIHRLNKVFLFLIVFCLGVSRSAYCQDEEYRVRGTLASCLNVRSTASADGPSIDCLPPGTLVKVICLVPFWREVIYGNNQRGWVAKKFIEPIENFRGPVDTTIPTDAFLTIHFVDVGQGDAIWLQTYDDGIDGNGIFEGYSIIIDGGPYSADDSNPLLPYIEREGHHGADIEALFVSHPHSDHFRGAETISRHFSINHYYDPGYPSHLSSYNAFLSAMKGASGHSGRARQVHIGKANFGSINWGRELKVEVLYSWEGDLENVLGSGNTEVNNSSIVLRVQYGKDVFLFMGDAEGKERDDDPNEAKYVEKILLETVPDRLKATVLKIAHHGSETSSSIPFIEAVDPEIIVVQSGRLPFHDTFLPDHSTLQRYCAHNPQVQIYRTDEEDEHAGHSTREAVDSDHIVIQSNGRGTPLVRALQGGQPTTPHFCTH
jgi:competence protein ComEC